MIDNPALKDAAENTASGRRRKIPPSGIRVGPSICRPDGDFDGRRGIHTAEGAGRGGVRPLSLRVYHVRYEPYLNFFRRTVCEMAVKARRTSGRRWIC